MDDSNRRENNDGLTNVSTRAQRKRFGQSDPDTNVKVPPIQLAKMDSTALGALSARLSSEIGADGFFIQRFGVSARGFFAKTTLQNWPP